MVDNGGKKVEAFKGDKMLPSTFQPQIEEFKALREEIVGFQRAIVQVFTFSVIAAGALIGYGLNSQVGYLFLAPFAILLPCGFGIVRKMDAILRNGAYIKFFIEDEVEGFQWETVLYKSRQKETTPKVLKWFRALGGEGGILGTFDGLSVACFALSAIFWEDSYYILGGVLGVIFCVLVRLNWAFLDAYSFQRETRLVEHFNLLKEKLQTVKANY